MTGDRKKPPGGESGEEPRSFAPARPDQTPVGAIRQDVGEDPGDLSPADEKVAGGAGEAGKNGRKLRNPMESGRQLPSRGATGGIGGGSGAD
jgi:hypothetical protein